MSDSLKMFHGGTQSPTSQTFNNQLIKTTLHNFSHSSTAQGLPKFEDRRLQKKLQNLLSQKTKANNYLYYLKKPRKDLDERNTAIKRLAGNRVGP